MKQSDITLILFFVSAATLLALCAVAMFVVHRLNKAKATPPTGVYYGTQASPRTRRDLDSQVPTGPQP